MIDIKKAERAFESFLDKYKNQNELGFELKVVHTYKTKNLAKSLAKKLNLKEEEIALAELIGLLHDIGRFEEITFLKTFDSINFDHASYGVKMLFDDNLIRNFISDNTYDEIIKIAINNHNKKEIDSSIGIGDKSLLHSKIIRDADKLDNFRVKKEEKIEAVFPKIVKNKTDIESSYLSDKVYEAVKNKKCVDIHDRKTPLDYCVCLLAFVFDLNFKESYEIIKNNNYINILIDKFNYNDLKTKKRMEEIRNIMNCFVNEQVRK